ncbi:MAG: hypothetical protein A2W25_04390 [candidate division Zixibacteria bacterium RBG_16_53_22]|nr:MAG: hypothetical protein A2W25_04390 [candidate division Zixibacteria bacterium RBG_16_53_22]
MGKDKNDDDEDTLRCTNCGDVFENTANLRRLKNKTGKFICPDCLAEAHGKADEDEGEEEEEEEEEEEAEEPEPEDEKPKKKK